MSTTETRIDGGPMVRDLMRAKFCRVFEAGRQSGDKYGAPRTLHGWQRGRLECDIARGIFEYVGYDEETQSVLVARPCDVQKVVLEKGPGYVA